MVVVAADPDVVVDVLDLGDSGSVLRILLTGGMGRAIAKTNTAAISSESNTPANHYLNNVSNLR